MAERNSQPDFDLTRDDLKDIKEALKKEEFRNLLTNYFEEVSDPKNKAIFQEELTEFEKQRGVDITFINPEGGYVIKTSADGKKKAFINICSNENVGKPTSTSVTKDGSPGLNWSIPYFQGQPREDVDNKYEVCSVYDVLFHLDTLNLARKDPKIKKLVNDIALTAVEDAFKVKIDRQNISFPKLVYKGSKLATVIRRRRDDFVEGSEVDEPVPGCPYPYAVPEKNPVPKRTTPRSNSENGESVFTTPRYLVKHRREIDMKEWTYARDAKFHAAIPSHLVVEIDLPLIKSALDVNLDVIDKSLSLISEKPAKYKLNINLPYSVDDENGNAQFDKKKKKLVVTLPVIRSKLPSRDSLREDSGIESDANQNNSSSSEEDIQKNINPVQAVNDNTEEQSSENCLIRTGDEIKTEFLRNDIHYALPKNNVFIKEELVKIRIIVKNVEPQSVAHQFLEAAEGVHFKFTSLGAGFFPVHFAYCLKIPGVVVETSSLKFNVWDNCLTCSLVIKSSKEITSYFVGPSLDEMEIKEVVSNEKAEQLRNEMIADKFENLTKKGDGDTVEDNSSEEAESLEGQVSSEASKLIEGKNVQDSESGKQIENAIDDVSIIPSKSINISPKKIRAFSESNELPDSFTCEKRSILKGSRSLSESHSGDYNTWSSIDSDSHDDLTVIKKTVRFSDVVSKKIFRANSSILGQRRKNEKKSRNRKKGAHERTLSAGSEESETDREEFDSSSMSEMSDVSSDENSGSGTVSSKNAVVPSSNKHRRRGAKNQRKTAATAKFNYSADC